MYRLTEKEVQDLIAIEEAIRKLIIYIRRQPGCSYISKTWDIYRDKAWFPKKYKCYKPYEIWGSQGQGGCLIKKVKTHKKAVKYINKHNGEMSFAIKFKGKFIKYGIWKKELWESKFSFLVKIDNYISALDYIENLDKSYEYVIWPLNLPDKQLRLFQKLCVN